MCNNVENKQNVVVAPKDTQPLTPNGTKGLWDKHVEMYETTDIPTEYADCEEDWADTEEYVREFIKEAIITKETNIYSEKEDSYENKDMEDSIKAYLKEKAVVIENVFSVEI